MCKIVINADDFGISEQVNQAICRCFQKNYINQTTLMMNMEYVEDAITLAKKYGFEKKIGLHLNLVEGVPLTPEIQKTKLCDAQGRFNGQIIRNNSYRLYLDRKTRKCVSIEIEAQIKKFVELNIGVRHLDSHQHSHTNLSVLFLLYPLLKKYRFESVRLSRNLPVKKRKGVKGVYKLIVNKLIISYNKKYSNRKEPVFFGSLGDYCDDVNKYGNMELMVHPILIDGDIHDAFSDVELEKKCDFINKRQLLM